MPGNPLLNLHGALDLCEDITTRSSPGLSVNTSHKQMAVQDVDASYPSHQDGKLEDLGLTDKALDPNAKLPFKSKDQEMLLPCHIHRLSTEVLCEIFSHEKKITIQYPNSVEAPAFALMLVCTRWRDIVEATPSLWNCIELIDEWDEEGIYSPIWQICTDDVMSSILLRSGKLPLDVVIDFETSSYQDYEEGVLPLIIAESQRWRHVEIHCNMQIEDTLAKAIMKAFASVRGELNLLQSLSLSFPGLAYSRRKSRRKVKMFSEAPLLTNLTLHGSLDGFALPWEQLRRVELLPEISPRTSYMPPEEASDYRDMLARADDLQHVVLYDTATFTPTEQQSKSITSISVHGPFSIADASFSGLTVLVVQDLQRTRVSRDNFAAKETQSLTRVLREHSATLQDLTLEYGASEYERDFVCRYFPPGSSIAFVTSRLQELTATLRAGTQSALQSNVEHVLPNLQRLEIKTFENTKRCQLLITKYSFEIATRPDDEKSSPVIKLQHSQDTTGAAEINQLARALLNRPVELTVSDELR